MSGRTGRLVLVGTPIGNLGDASGRMAQALRDADAIACEDTRRTRALLSHLGIPTPDLVVIEEHREAAQIRGVLARLGRGEEVAVITDAGMPGISDPGERLVRAAVADGYDVTCVPGASAVLAALVVSGLPTGRFVVEGFLPRRGGDRSDRLVALGAEDRTMVLFEAPHRLGRTLADLAAALGGDRQVVVARELTKVHEEVWRGTLAEAVSRAEADAPRGEHVVVVAGRPRAVAGPVAADAAALAGDLVAAGLAAPAVAKLLQRHAGLERDAAYEVARTARRPPGSTPTGAPAPG